MISMDRCSQVVLQTSLLQLLQPRWNGRAQGELGCFIAAGGTTEYDPYMYCIMDVLIYIYI